MNRLGRNAFVVLCAMAIVLLIVALLVFAGVGVEDKPASTTSLGGVAASG